MLNKIIIFIESPGKIATLNNSLSEIEFDADIISTGGHLYANQKDMSQVGVNQYFKETDRSPIPERRDTIQAIANTRHRYQYYLIATDPDQEGDVIAGDIANLLSGEKIMRVHLTGLDPESVKLSLEASQQYNDQMKWAGETRRIVDRLISYSFYDKASGCSVGRVQSAILGSISKKPIPVAEVVLKVKATASDHFDGLAYYQATLLIGKKTSLEEVDDALFFIENYEAELIDSVKHQETPWNFAQCVISCAKELESDIRSVSASMQRLYEAGKLSYPRSMANAVRKSSLDCLKDIASKHNLQQNFNTELVAAIDEDVSSDGFSAHESPRPLHSDLVIANPLRLLQFDHAVLACITRNLMLCGLDLYKLTPDKREFPEIIRHLDWHRIQYPSALPWQYRQSNTANPSSMSELALKSRRTLEISLLERMNREKIGRPSTQINHVQRFLDKELMSDGHLNEKGLAWFGRTPSVFLSSESSNLIESNIAKASQMPPEMRTPWVLAQVSEDVLGFIENKMSGITASL